MAPSKSKGKAKTDTVAVENIGSIFPIEDVRDEEDISLIPLKTRLATFYQKNKALRDAYKVEQ